MQNQHVTAEEKTRLFVIEGASGNFSMLGFGVCYAHTVQLLEVLGLTHIELEEIGTVEQYEQYCALVSLYGKSPVSQKTWFEPGTFPEVGQALDLARVKGMRLRLWYGDPATGQDFMRSRSVLGYIGRSSGPMRSPILLHSRITRSGALIDTAEICRLVETKTRREIFRHPTYYIPAYRFHQDTNVNYPFVILEETVGNELGRFKSASAQLRWAQFMEGERFSIK